MAYTFTITEVTPNIGLTVSPAANFTVTNAVNSLTIAETNPQFTVTNVPDNAITINDDGYVFTLTNVDSLVTLTNSPAFVVTATNAVQSFNLTQNTNNFNFSATNITFTATTAIGQIQTENMATIFKGEFTSTAEIIYYRGHIVRHNQNIYVATVEPGARITNPAAPPGNDQWTLIFSQTGLQGFQVTAMEKAYNQGPWNAGATYALYTWVEHQGYIWELENQSGSYNSEPSRNNPYWKQIGSQGDQALFTTSSVTFQNLTVNDRLTASRGVVTNFTVTNRLQAGAIKYPLGAGLYGQVLTTNGVNEANWTDAASTGSGTLRAATRENLGGVIIGTGLNVTAGGVISITTGTNGANIGWNLTDDLTTNGFGIYTGAPDPINENFPVPTLEIGSGERGAVDASLSFEARTGLVSVVKLVGDTIRIASGNPSFNTFNNEVRVSSSGTNILGPTTFLGGDVRIAPTNNSRYLGSTATSFGTSTSRVYIGGSVFGVVRPGLGTYIDIQSPTRFANGITGEFSISPVRLTNGIRFGDGTTQTTAGVTTQFVLTTATDSTLGGVKVGSGLVINAATGVLSVSTVSSYILPTADTNVKGGVRLGTSFYIGETPGFPGINETLYLRTATSSTVGGIYVTDPFFIPDGSPGDLDIRYATTSTKGVIKVGAGLGIDIEGRLYADTNTGTNAVVADGLHGIEIIGNEIRLKTATTSTIGGFRTGGVAVNMIGDELNIQQATTTQLGVIKVGTGLTHNEFSTVSVTAASTTTFGGITLGYGLALDGNGKTYVTISGTTGTTSTYTLPIASTSTLGGVKIGRNITIDGDGTINATTTSTGVTGQFNLDAESYTNGYKIAYNNTATGNSTNLTITASTATLTAGFGFVNVASPEVKIGTTRYGGDRNVTINENGVTVYSNESNYLTLGSNAYLTSPTINFVSRNNGGSVRLDEAGIFDAKASANGFRVELRDNSAKMYVTTATGSAKLILQTGESTLEADDTLTLIAPTLMKLSSPFIQMGSLFNSRLFVGTIQNFSGTGPPLLADGVQYGDLSVQRTAYPAYDYGQVIKSSAFGPSVPQDFNNPSLAVDFNS